MPYLLARCRRFAVTVLFPIALLSGCGKVGNPQPPFIRIPLPVTGLQAGQNGYDVVLSWINPQHYIDGSTATDLQSVHITSEGAVVASVPSLPAGSSQSYSIPAGSWVGTTRRFTVWTETARGKLSERASVSATPVPVPGGVTALKAGMDQYALTVQWGPPASNADLANGYYLHRSDSEEPPVLLHELEFRDTSFQPGEEYTYEVTAARQVQDTWIRGAEPQTVKVRAVDQTAPQTPTGLAVAAADNGAFVTWSPNPELDLAGYRIFREGRLLNSGELRKSNSFFDPDYTPGQAYTVSAVDEAGNESPQTPPVRQVREIRAKTLLEYPFEQETET